MKYVRSLCRFHRILLYLVVLLVPALLWGAARPAFGTVVLELDGQRLATDVPPVVESGRVLVPFRSLLEALGAQVTWDARTRTASAVRRGQYVQLTVDSTLALVNGNQVQIDVPARNLNGHIFVPARFVSEQLGASVEWDATANVVRISSRPGLRTVTESVAVNGKTYSARVVEIPRSAGLKAEVALAQGRVGAVEDLAGMASRVGAIAAINGTYFQAYATPPDPWNTIIYDGRAVHVGDPRGTVGFRGDGTAVIGLLQVKIEGELDGSYAWPNNWYAYGLNHTPAPGGSSVYIFTPDHGPNLGFAYGTAVVVENGQIQSVVTDQDVTIPPDGFVINLTGNETYLLDRFTPGLSIGYRTVFTDAYGRDWSGVTAAVAAGPLLLVDGQVVVNPAAERFQEDKILTLASTRSAIGIKPDGTVLLVVVPGITVSDMAVLMQSLGARDAQCLDGGGSSGLWFRGHYIFQPGRLLSNALVFVPQDGP